MIHWRDGRGKVKAPRYNNSKGGLGQFNFSSGSKFIFLSTGGEKMWYCMAELSYKNKTVEHSMQWGQAREALPPDSRCQHLLNVLKTFEKFMAIWVGSHAHFLFLIFFKMSGKDLKFTHWMKTAKLNGKLICFMNQGVKSLLPCKSSLVLNTDVNRSSWQSPSSQR